MRQMQDVCGKLQQSRNIRCSGIERLAFPRLVAQLVDTANDLSHDVLNLITIKPPNEAAKKLADNFQLQSHKSNTINKSIFRRNLNLIFLGPQVSALDSGRVKARKERMRDRCSIIVSLKPSHIVLWSLRVPPSAWDVSTMAGETFYYLVQELGKLPITEWPKGVTDSLYALSLEEPFTRIEKFSTFAEGICSLC